MIWGMTFLGDKEKTNKLYIKALPAFYRYNWINWKNKPSLSYIWVFILSHSVPVQILCLPALWIIMVLPDTNMMFKFCFALCLTPKSIWSPKNCLRIVVFISYCQRSVESSLRYSQKKIEHGKKKFALWF